MGVDYYLRGWLAIVLVQQLGVLLQITLDSESLQRAFLVTSVGRKTLRPYAMLFFLFGSQQIIVKAALQIAFHNRALHVVNVGQTATTIVFLALEVFLYEHFQLSTATLTQLALSVLTVVFTLLAWPQISAPLKNDGEPEGRARKLIAKHYMEAQVGGLQTEPKKSK